MLSCAKEQAVTPSLGREPTAAVLLRPVAVQVNHLVRTQRATLGVNRLQLHYLQHCSTRSGEKGFPRVETPLCTLSVQTNKWACLCTHVFTHKSFSDMHTSYTHLPHARAHARAHTHTHAHTCAHTHERTLMHTHARTHMSAHT